MRSWFALLLVLICGIADAQTLAPDQRPHKGVKSQSSQLGLGTVIQCVNGPSGGIICPGNINNNLPGTTELDGSATLGFGALANSTVEGFNTAIGMGALYGLQGSEGKYSFNNYGTVYNGVMNTAVGLKAMYTSTALGCTSGTAGVSLNTVVGALAGYSLACTSGTGAYSGVYIGEADALRVTTGFFNVMIGNDILSQTSATGSTHDTVIIGAEAVPNGGGNYQVIIGSHAGSSNVTGIENVIIGPYAASTTLTTGTANILIGVDNHTDTAAASTSNTLKISGASSTPILTATSTNTANPLVAIPGVTTGTNADFACFAAGGVFTLQSSACTISRRNTKENIRDLSPEVAVDDLMNYSPSSSTKSKRPRPIPISISPELSTGLSRKTFQTSMLNSQSMTMTGRRRSPIDRSR